MNAIKWSELDRRLVDDWERRAVRATGVERFVYAFIVINHYYSAWAIHKPPPTQGDRAEMLNLATLPVVQDLWPKFRTLNTVKGRKISLPILNQRGREVPVGVAPGDYEAATLTLERYLEVIYQVRCDLFHARRSAVGFRNELAIYFASDASLDLVHLLMRETASS